MTWLSCAGPTRITPSTMPVLTFICRFSSAGRWRRARSVIIRARTRRAPSTARSPRTVVWFVDGTTVVSICKQAKSWTGRLGCRRTAPQQVGNSWATSRRIERNCRYTLVAFTIATCGSRSTECTDTKDPERIDTAIPSLSPFPFPSSEIRGCDAAAFLPLK